MIDANELQVLLGYEIPAPLGVQEEEAISQEGEEDGEVGGGTPLSTLCESRLLNDVGECASGKR